MKTVVGQVSFAALAIAVTLWLSACPPRENGGDNNDKNFTLKIGNRGNNHWVDVNQRAFDAALTVLPKEQWKISFLCQEGATPEDNYDPGDPHHHPVCVRTDKVTKSETTDKTSAGDPNVTQHIRVQRADELKAVLDAFAEASPTPTP